jgi:hypothetical protein
LQVNISRNIDENISSNIDRNISKSAGYLCGCVTFGIFVISAIVKSSKRSALLPSSSSNKKVKRDDKNKKKLKEDDKNDKVVYKQKDKSSTRADISKMTPETIHDIIDRQCNCKFYVDKKYRKTTYGVEKVSLCIVLVFYSNLN